MSQFRICIAGSREFTDYSMLQKFMLQWGQENKAKHGDKEIIIVSGAARGADRLGERFAHQYGLALERYPADWGRFGKSAGYHRNQAMADVSDLIIIFWDGESRGTKHMIDISQRMGKDVRVIEYTKPPWE